MRMDVVSELSIELLFLQAFQKKKNYQLTKFNIRQLDNNI